ncbi:MAG: carboxypeptidase-like regulatory domain-containing protein [Candidatus Fimenecus sp.]
MTTQTKKKVSSKVVALLLTALLLLTMVPVGLLTTVFAAGTAYTVTVTDTADDKLEGAKVTLTPTDATQAESYTYTVTTDVNGEAVFTDLTDAVNADDTLSIAYTVTVEKEGYQYYGDPIGVTVSQENATGGETVKLTKVYAFSIVHDTAAADITVDGQVYDGATMAVLPAGTHTVHIEPNAGYVYKGATKNGAEATAEFAANTDIALDLTEDTALGFSFIQQFVITVNCGADGTVTYDDGVSVTDGGKVYAMPGTDKTFCFAAAANYKLASVTVDAVDVTADVKDGKYKLTNIGADHTLTVAFEKLTHKVTAYAHIIKANHEESNQPNTTYGTVKLSATGIASTPETDKNGKQIGESIEIPFDQAVTVTFVPTAKSVSNVYQLSKVTVDGSEQKVNGLTYEINKIPRDLTVRAYFENVKSDEKNAADLISVTGDKDVLLSTFEQTVDETQSDGSVIQKVTDVYYVYSSAEGGSVWVRPVNTQTVIDLCGKTLSDNAYAHYFGETRNYKTSEEISFNKIHAIENGVQTVYTLNQTVHIVFDKTAPVLADGDVAFATTPASYTDKTGTQYKNGIFEFTVTAKDAKTLVALTNREIDDCKVTGEGAYNGIQSVSYQVTQCQVTEQGDTKVTVLEEKTVDGRNADSASGTASVFTCPLDMTSYTTGTYTVSFTVTDKAGNTSAPLTKTIVIDNTAPALAEGQAITFTSTNEGFFAKTVNMLTFGAFCKPGLKAEVKVADAQSGLAGKDAGKAKMILKIGNNRYDNGYTGTYKDGVYTFTYDKADLAAALGNGATAETILPLTCAVEFEIIDNVGNMAKFVAGKENSNLKNDSGLIMIEETAPVVTGGLDESAKTEFRSAEDISFTVQDADSGLFKVEMSYRYNGAEEGTAFALDNTALGSDVDANEKITERTYTLNLMTTDGLAQGDGQYDITVTVTDNAGNQTTVTKTFYLDSTAPAVTGFKLFTNGSEVSNEAVEITDYGYYFKQAATLEVYLTDAATTAATEATRVPVQWTSGVDKVQYYTIDSDGNTSPVAEAELNTEKTTAKIQIQENFKGQIYVMPTDVLGNTPADTEHMNDVYTDDFMASNGYADGYIHPNGTILETQDKHDAETHIVLEKADSDMTDNKGQMLYNGAVAVKVTVMDAISGIRTVHWAQTSQVGAGLSGTLTVLNQKDNIGTNYAVGDTLSADGVVWTVEAVDNNLVTQLSATITVTDNSNDIDFTVDMVDRAGNTAADAMETFSIDTTAPIINVEYSNNKSDTQYTDYFNADRIATITIQERNLDLVSVQEDIARVLYEITNTDSVIPTLVGFEAVNIDENNPDNNVYQATIAYTADGDYTFKISCTDRAENANNGVNYGDSVAPETFTIDKTLPVVTVVYDNNTSKTGTNFYDAQRVATITVQEHNFDVARVLVTGTANDDGAPFAFPATSVWTHNGDTHTATITYAADGKYAFDIAFADMASNNAADYAGDEFYIDNTDPMPTITDTDNGPNGSAFNGDVVPKITCFDKNIDVNRITVTLSGTDKYGNAIRVSWSESLQESMSDENTKNYALNCLNAKVENAYNKLFDGDYTLRVEMTDLAGRTASAEKHFSVNRFGSDYVLTAPQDVNGRYVTSTGDLVIEEINVNALDRTQIIVTLYTADQAGKTLVEGVDYTLEQIGKINRYTIFAKNFENDSVYTLTIYSVDAAGNKNDSTDESKELKIEFVIDKVPPVITSETLDTTERKNNRPKAESLDAVFAVTDNHEVNVDSLTFTVDGNPVQYTVDDAGKYHIVLTESKNWQTVSVSVQDTAGQAAEAVEAQVLVTTNLFIRWYSNTPLFVGSLAGGAAVVAVAVALVVKRKKKIDA